MECFKDSTGILLEIKSMDNYSNLRGNKNVIVFSLNFIL